MLTEPYGLMADLHCHNWSAFHSFDGEGRSTRLMAIVNEVYRCAEMTKSAGGKKVVIAGDLFHVRGSVSSAVFNPVKAALEDAAATHGVVFHIIPGNHDLATKDSQELGSSVKMIEGPHVCVYHDPVVHHSTGVVLIPWQRDVATLLEVIEKTIAHLPASAMHYDLVIHRGIDGTLSNLPPSGFTAEKLKAFGFKHVFAGDYHHHKDFGDGIYSIGAPTHQTWSDVNTKAGFLIVYPNRVDWVCTHAPQFVDITDADPDDVPLIVDGQFVRMNMGEATPAEVAEARALLLSYGAVGVNLQATPKTTMEKREGVSAKSLAALDKSVLDYVNERGMPPQVGTLCAAIMKEISL